MVKEPNKGNFGEANKDRAEKGNEVQKRLRNPRYGVAYIGLELKLSLSDNKQSRRSANTN